MNYAQEIREFISSNFLFEDASEFSDDTSFLDTGIIDSTGMLELIGFLEKKYQISVEPEEMVPENLDSVNRAAAYVRMKTTPGPAVLEESLYGKTTILRSSASN